MEHYILEGGLDNFSEHEFFFRVRECENFFQGEGV